MTFENDLTSPEFFADPHAVYHRLRAAAPVYWSEVLGGWVLTRYADTVSVLHKPQLYSSAGRVTYLLRQLPDAARRQVEALEAHYRVGIAHSDPPDHTRLRALLSRAFTPRMVESQRATVAALVDELLEAVQGQAEMDVIRDLAYPLPASIIAGMIGAPREDREQFRLWAGAINALHSGGGRVTTENALRAQQTQTEMRDYILALAAERRRRPQDDLISAMVSAQDQASKLSEAELVSTCVTLFVAGHETTTNLIGNGLLLLLRHPEQLTRLRQDPARIHSAIEEMLRYEPSVPRAWRLAIEDIELDGQRIRQGQMVLAMIAAANRDPAQFRDPDRFDICRQENKHLGFGYGIHFCLGAPLARLEAPIAIQALLARFPRLRLTDKPLTWMPDIAIRGLTALPVALD